MKLGISHNFKEETPDAKAEWFQSLPLEKRMELFSSFIDLILENNPGILEKKNAQPIAGRIQVLSKS